MMPATIDHTATPDTTTMGTMRSIVQERYGLDPDAVLAVTEIAAPTVGAGEVLVRVAAASVDQGTVHCMTGMPYAMRFVGFGVRAPKASNPGRSLAGIVEAVGTGVTGFVPGDEVYGSAASAFAEFAAVDAGSLAHKPAGTTFEAAASVPISGGTALQAVQKAGVKPGQSVLITGASGGVGTFAVQIAKAFGAEVTGVCSTAKFEMVRTLGADHVVDYQVDDFTAAGRRYDVILDAGGATPLSDIRRALTDDGTLVIIGGENGGKVLGDFARSLRSVLVSPFVSQTLGMLASTENAASLDELRDLIESGQVTPAVERAFPLTETAAAIRHVIDGRVRGKVVIVV